MGSPCFFFFLDFLILDLYPLLPLFAIFKVVFQFEGNLEPKAKIGKLYGLDTKILKKHTQKGKDTLLMSPLFYFNLDVLESPANTRVKILGKADKFSLHCDHGFSPFYPSSTSSF